MMNNYKVFQSPSASHIYFIRGFCLGITFTKVFIIGLIKRKNYNNFSLKSLNNKFNILQILFINNYFNFIKSRKNYFIFHKTFIFFLLIFRNIYQTIMILRQIISTFSYRIFNRIIRITSISEFNRVSKYENI